VVCFDEWGPDLRQAEAGELGLDPRLRRLVWIHRVEPGSPPLAEPIQRLGRRGRLRWITGRREGDENYDAYEGVGGRPILDPGLAPRPWTEVREWLLDLAEEGMVAFGDDTLPPTLALDRIWITDSGRAILLDAPAPGTADLPRDPVPLHNPIDLVMQTCWYGLTGSPARTPADLERLPPIPLPLYAQEALAGILAEPDETAARIQEVVSRPATITRKRRIILLAATAAPALLVGAFALAAPVLTRPTQTGMERALLARLLKRYESTTDTMLGRTPEERERNRARISTFIAVRFRPLLTDTTAWSRGTLAAHRASAAGILAQHPNVSSADFEEVSRELRRLRLTPPPASGSPAFRGGLIAFLAALLSIGAGSVLLAPLFHGGLYIHAMSIGYVTGDGARASRWRLLGRSLVAWAPVLIASTNLGVSATGPALFLRQSWLLVIGLVVFLTGVVYSIAHPARGIPDRIAGTWMVPR